MLHGGVPAGGVRQRNAVGPVLSDKSTVAPPGAFDQESKTGGRLTHRMQREFWLDRWDRNEIGFHQTEVNPWLERYWGSLGVAAGRPVFVPLCGKSLDLGWLAGQGHPVVGVEFAEAAVRAYFEEAGQPCRVERCIRMPCWVGGGISIYCGDFMELTAFELRGVAGVYDRAALVALPPRMRLWYVDHLLRIVPDQTRILLVTLEYDQRLWPGPPHSVTGPEVERLYGERCSIARLGEHPVQQLPPPFRAAGVDAALEVVYHIVKES
jgi:thiopurine S-methyltransferase